MLFSQIRSQDNASLNDKNLTEKIVLQKPYLSVKNQVPQVFFKLIAGDLMLVSYYEFAHIIFCE